MAGSTIVDDLREKWALGLAVATPGIPHANDETKAATIATFARRLLLLALIETVPSSAVVDRVVLAW